MLASWYRRRHEPGGASEVLRLAWPLVLSNGFWTLQTILDSLLLSWYDTDAVGAVTASVMLFWTALQLPHSTALYATSFVAQYHGARRSARVGPVVWQAIHFSVLTGLAFLLLLPAVRWFVQLGSHHPRVQDLETTYLSILCYAALPLLLQAAVAGFFTGLGHTRVVVLMDAFGTLVNAGLGWVLIFGRFGFPELGIAGAGWATVIGSWSAALLGLGLMFRRAYRAEFATLSGWRLDWRLFGRLLKFGVPSGLQWTLDALCWAIFVWMVGRFGAAELAATSLAFNLNLVAYMPTLGLAQAAAVLVGQRLGEDRPDLAERSVWTTFGLGWCLMALLGVSLVLFPGVYLELFRPLEGHSGELGASWERVTQLVPALLCFVAAYCLFDSMNLVFALALKGAGDVRFVTVVSMALAWGVMVVPTWLTLDFGGGLFLAWGFAACYVLASGFLFWWRFRQGAWKSLRLIEPEEAGVSALQVEKALVCCSEPSS
jgi:MATE family multidrug resistance protein